MEAGTASPAQARHATTGTDDKTRTGMHGRGCNLSTGFAMSALLG